MPFKQMENIAVFLKGVSQVPGIRSFDLFMTVDLFEAKNLEQVKRCLMAWKRTSEKNGTSLFSGNGLAKEQEKALPAVESEPVHEATFTQQKPESSVSESGFEASRSNSFQSFKAIEVDEQVEASPVLEIEEVVEISFVEPEVILPPDSPIENNFADIDEPTIECVAAE